MRPEQVNQLREALTRCTQLLVLSCGNPSRGDDGAGLLVHEQLALFKDRQPALPVRLIHDFQLQIEDILEIRDGDLIMFVDACINSETALSIKAVETAPAQGAFSHNLSPSQWLAIYQEVSGKTSDALQVGIAGKKFDLGDDALSAETQSACLQFTEGLERLIVERFNA